MRKKENYVSEEREFRIPRKNLSVGCLNLIYDNDKNALIDWIRTSLVIFAKWRSEAPIKMTERRLGDRDQGWRLITPQES